jgi:hypothetical protein
MLPTSPAKTEECASIMDEQEERGAFRRLLTLVEETIQQ